MNSRNNSCLCAVLVVAILFTRGCDSQNANQLDVDDIQKKLGDIPGMENANLPDLPNEEDVEKLLKEKCDKNGGGEEAFAALKNQKTALQECLEQQLNYTQIQVEIEEAKKTGSMDEVFGKYCKKYPEVYKCAEQVTDAARPCLSLEEQKTLNKSLKIVDELKEFLCFKDGDRIAMFIAEGGIECLESKKVELQDCANKTLGSKIPKDLSISALPNLIFGQQECHDFDDIRSCVNVELEKCKDSTPANVVDAFFKFLKKHMPCDGTVVRFDFNTQKETTGSSSKIVMSYYLTAIVASLASLNYFC